MEAADLLSRLQAFAAMMALFNSAREAAIRDAAANPAASLPQLDALLLDLPKLRDTELELVAAMGEHSILSAAECAAQWRSRASSLLNARLGAAALLADAGEVSRTGTMAAGLLEPDDPFHATLWEKQGESAADPAEAAQLFDEAFALRLRNVEAPAAAQNRSIAASLAAAAGWLRRARDCADEAIAIAERHGLRREQILFRMRRFQLLLIADAAGIARQEVKAELDFVSRPRGALPDLLERTYADGLAALQGPNPADVARAFGLGAQYALRDEGEGARAAAAAALEAQRDDQRLLLLLLAAQAKGRLGDWDTPAEDILPLALALARTPEQRSQVYGAMADAAEGVGNAAAALSAMEQAVLALGGSRSATVLAQARARLAALRADETDGIRDPALDNDDYVVRRSGAALASLLAGQQQRALSVLDGLADLTRSDLIRGKLALLRGAGLFELDRLDEAAASFADAAALFDPALDRDPEGEGDWLAQREAAGLLLAVTLVRLGRPVDAWVAAERARSPKLARALGVAEPDWPAMREALAAQRAAILTVHTMRWGTLVLSAAPGEAEPRAALLPLFRAPDMERLLQRNLGDDSDAWNDVLLDAIPGLSAGLVAPLADRLREVASASAVLYLMPGGSLWHAPWAALEVAPGVPLAELVPLSLLPFARLLCAAPPAANPCRSIQAMAVGRDIGGFEFTGHLDRLAPSLASCEVAWMRGGAATAAALAGAAARDLLYLSCHGTIDGSTPAIDRSSQLILADGPLPAGTLAGWTLGSAHGSANLCFLNACQTGRFRAGTQTELGGFPAAFLRAGRPTLVAPLTHVDPQSAGDLARAFLDAFLGEAGSSGMAAAAALRHARLALHRAGASPSDWAMHTMFGPDVRPEDA